MRKNNIPPGDDYLIRCPKLGHQIAFAYCRSENNGLPCLKALDCWFDHFPVEEYFRGALSQEEWERVFEGPPRPKMHTLLELIERTQKTKQ
jgi:hypothetical protein